MTREELRAKLLAGADALRNSLAWRIMTPEQRLLSSCGRQFWAAQNIVTDDALDDFLALVNAAKSQSEGDPT